MSVRYMHKLVYLQVSQISIILTSAATKQQDAFVTTQHWLEAQVVQSLVIILHVEAQRGSTVVASVTVAVAVIDTRSVVQ